VATIQPDPIVVCDRCGRPVEDPETDNRGLLIYRHAPSGTLEKQTPVLLFDDICEKCDKAITSLFERLVLGKKKEKKGDD
jgi:hypothetical protein